MKIISKFSDYYDCGLAYGIDEKLVFKREKKIVKESCYGLSHYSATRSKDGKKIRASFHCKVMGFCGKFIPLVHIMIEEVTKRDKVFEFKLIEETYVYDMESADSFLGLYFTPLEEIVVDETRWYSARLREVLERFFTQMYRDKKDIFKKYQVPYFLLERVDSIDAYAQVSSRYQCQLLPCLKEFRFVKAREPIEAFQEISMYLGSLNLAEDNTIPQGQASALMIEDKYLAQAKGYDCYSFKKMPQKRRVKKC